MKIYYFSVKEKFLLSLVRVLDRKEINFSVKNEDNNLECFDVKVVNQLDINTLIEITRNYAIKCYKTIRGDETIIQIDIMEHFYI